MRKPIIAGNWKMHKTVAEARKLALDVKNSTLNIAREIDTVLCPPFGALAAVGEVLKGSDVKLGAQNCHWEDKGAFTGEMSTVMLKDIGCDYVIVGHSERRTHFGETDDWVAKKAKALHDHGLLPIICIGENLEEREAGTTKDVVRGQLLGSLRGISGEEMLRTVVAYEPIWAIGTGKTATPEQAQEVHAFVRNILIDLHGLEVALRIRIQYGGSVKPDNTVALMAQADIDGALVGGASLDAAIFTRILSYKTGGDE
ncbi:MAG: triose-phosphate isomerase [Candidatus Eisenbacteria bacterium]